MSAQSTAGILDRIVAARAAAIARDRRRTPLAELRRRAADPNLPRPRGFAAALARTAASQGLAVIAEAKQASPSSGVIRSDYDPAALARGYARAGAAALSVLTEGPHFGGELAHLAAARAAVSLPVLQKDFLIDPWQVYASRLAGADAVLLIARILPGPRLHKLRLLAAELGMDALVEVHTAAELDLALSSGARLIGINNRDLATFKTSLQATLALAPRVPPDVLLVSESGIATPDDLRRLQAAGVRAVLVGESLLRAADPGAQLARLLQGRKEVQP